MPVGIEIRGLAELRRKMAAAQRDLQPELLKAMERAVKHVHATVPPYPAPPAGSNYRRTGTLGRSITTEARPLGSDVVGSIGTPVVYAPWVISSEKTAGGRGPQAGMHRGRWWTLQGVVHQARAEVIAIFEALVKRLGKLEL